MIGWHSAVNNRQQSANQSLIPFIEEKTA